MSTNSPSAQSLSLVEAFSQFGPAYRRWVKAQTSEGDVTFARLRLLGALQCSAEPRIMSALSDDLGVTPRNVTALVDALEAEQLVARRPHPTDRRATLIELTDQGSDLCAEAWDAHRHGTAELFEDLDPADREDLLRLVHRLAASLAARGITGCGQPTP